MSLSLLMPKEHGATVLLGASVLLGWYPEWSQEPEVIATVVAVVGLLFLREPLVRILRKRGSVDSSAGRRAMTLSVAAGTTIAISGSVVLFRVPTQELIPLLIVGAICLSASVISALRRSAWRWWIDVAGAVAAALPVPALRLATEGELDLVIYCACLVFYLGSTLHLRELLRQGPRMKRPEMMRPGKAALWSLASAGTAALALALGFLPFALAAPCTVALLRPIVMRGRVLNRTMRIGLVETGLTGLFVLTMMVTTSS